jgi:hypothetical protein
VRSRRTIGTHCPEADRLLDGKEVARLSEATRDTRSV